MENHSNLPADCQSESGKLGTIYLLTCIVTGKQYVGQTKQTLSRRINGHKNS